MFIILSVLLHHLFLVCTEKSLSIILNKDPDFVAHGLFLLLVYRIRISNYLATWKLISVAATCHNFMIFLARGVLHEAYSNCSILCLLSPTQIITFPQRVIGVLDFPDMHFQTSGCHKAVFLLHSVYSLSRCKTGSSFCHQSSG